MKRIMTSILILASVNAFAQTETLTKDDLAMELQPLKTSIQTLQKENGSLKYEISNLNIKLSNAYKSIDSLRTLTQKNSSAISQTASELGIKISATETNTNQKFMEVDKSLIKNSLYGMIGVLTAILISIFIYWLLNKRQKQIKPIFSKNLAELKLPSKKVL